MTNEPYVPAPQFRFEAGDVQVTPIRLPQKRKVVVNVPFYPMAYVDAKELTERVAKFMECSVDDVLLLGPGHSVSLVTEGEQCPTS